MSIVSIVFIVFIVFIMFSVAFVFVVCVARVGCIVCLVYTCIYLHRSHQYLSCPETTEMKGYASALYATWLIAVSLTALHPCEPAHSPAEHDESLELGTCPLMPSVNASLGISSFEIIQPLSLAPTCRNYNAAPSPFPLVTCASGPTSTCRNFPKPLRFTIPIVALASTRSSAFKWFPKSRAKLCTPRSSDAPFTAT